MWEAYTGRPHRIITIVPVGVDNCRSGALTSHCTPAETYNRSFSVRIAELQKVYFRPRRGEKRGSKSGEEELGSGRHGAVSSGARTGLKRPRD